MMDGTWLRRAMPFHAALLGAMMCLAAASIASARAAPVFNSPADVKAITFAEQDIATQTSMQGLMHYFSPDAVVLDFFAPGIYEGKNQIYNAFQAQLSGMVSMTHRIREMNVASDGSFADQTSRLF